MMLCRAMTICTRRLRSTGYIINTMTTSRGNQPVGIMRTGWWHRRCARPHMPRLCSAGSRRADSHQQYVNQRIFGVAWVHNSSVYPVVSKTPGYTPECGIAFLHCYCCHLATASTACVSLYMHTFVLHECATIIINDIVATHRFKNQRF